MCDSHRSMAKAPRLSLLALALCVALASSALLVAPAEAAAPRAFVQKGDGEIASGGSASVGFTRPNKSGNAIVGFVVWDNPGSVSLADSNGNAYQTTPVGPASSGDGSLRTQIFYARGIASGANTVTASFATPITRHAALYIHEYTRLGRVQPFDAATGASGTAAELDSGPLETSSSTELLFLGAASNGSSVEGLTRGFKTRARRGGELVAEGFSGAAGSYRVTGRQSGTGWVTQLAAFQYSGDAPESPAYPLGVGESGRYLIDQNGDPFLITGDSTQSLMVDLSESQAASFFSNRQKKGFNALWINLITGDRSGGRWDASTFDGIRPFMNGFDISQPNEAYFSRVDAILRLAARRGITVLLDPAETRSFLQVLLDNGATKSRAYGQYLGKRYHGFDNIIWMSGNDFHETELPSPEQNDVVQAVARGIQDFDDSHIHTVELNFLLSGSLDDPSWAPLIHLNASYTYYPTYAQVLKDYNRGNFLPTFLVEANYEFEHEAEDPNATEILRRQAWWAVLSGATGQMYGNKYTWPFLDGWQNHYNTPGATQMGYVKRLLEPRRWYELVPDQTHSVVTAGYGTFSDSDLQIGNNDYVTAARTPDGSLVMAYLPTTPSPSGSIRERVVVRPEPRHVPEDRRLAARQFRAARLHPARPERRRAQ